MCYVALFCYVLERIHSMMEIIVFSAFDRFLPLFSASLVITFCLCYANCFLPQPSYLYASSEMVPCFNQHICH